MTEIGDGRSRSLHMFEGRRVTVADLVEHGLLPGGTRLVFHRPRAGETYRATVSERGRVRLEDGQEFASPTRAASMCLGGTPGGDGWWVWRVGSPEGPRLDDLRQEFLESAAADSRGDTAEAEVSSARRHHEFLRHARERASGGEPIKIVVRDLIALWGRKSRGSRIAQQIEADLANHGLVTSPSFRKVTLDASVDLVLARGEEEPTEVVLAIATTDLDEDEELDVGLTVGNLPSALGGVLSVAATASFDEAITQMLLNDYSQLAVMSGTRTLRGAVTWRSIAKARHSNAQAAFSDAIIRPHEVPYDQDLVDILPILAEHDFVIVRDQHNLVAGIVTTADVAVAYGEMATPFVLIGEVDQHLRWLVQRNFSLDDVLRCCDPDGTRGLKDHDDLSFGDYQRLVERPELWEQLGWPLDRSVFVKRLDEMRQIRNDIMHFNPDPLPTDAVDKLRYFVGLLREYNS